MCWGVPSSELTLCVMLVHPREQSKCRIRLTWGCCAALDIVALLGVATMRLGQEVRAARILTLLLRLDTPLSPTLSCLLEEGRSALHEKLTNKGDDWYDAGRGEKGWACKHCAGGGQGAPNRAEPMLTAAALTHLARLQGALCLVLARPIHPSCVCVCVCVRVCVCARACVRVWRAR